MILRISLFVCAFAALAAAAAPGDVESRVTEFTLKNGLQVLVYVDSSAPVVATVVAYRVGSIDEPLGRTGISHMLEHMTFKHTDVYTPGRFDRIVDSAGGNSNGFTAEYYTDYFEIFSRDRWELALKLEAARMARCIFPDSEFESEHQVVREEVGLHENSPFSAFYDQFSALAFIAHPMHNPGIGWPNDVKNLTVAQVSDWYHERYNPANAVLAIAGDVRPDEVKAKAEKYLGGIKGKPVPRVDFYDLEPRQAGERRMTLRKRVSMPSLAIAYHTPGYRDSSRFAGEVLAGILGQGRNSRLYKTLVTDSGLAVSASAYFSYERDPELLRISVSPKAESLVPRIERIVEREIDRLRTDLAGERELERVKNSMTASFVFVRDDIMYMAIGLLACQICEGSWRSFETYPANVGRVTAEQVRDFCRTYLYPDGRTVGLLTSDRKEKQ